MKDTIWDLLSIIMLLLAGLAAIFMLILFANPYSFLNPLPPAELPPLQVLPTATATLKQLPGVWTPTLGDGVGPTFDLTSTKRPSSTPLPSSTGFRLPTATSTFTLTPTATDTATFTVTASQTKTSTLTLTPSATFTFTATLTTSPPDTPTATDVPPTDTSEAYPNP
ncbi:MAG: hypothetical protein BGO78_10510 [Chloroflexi bacterium 44-23]|nr:MAG: hypothetical protein BGO78_10510 [Chloroflexi bacterium 44-23]